MRKIHSTLRLFFEAGLSIRAIARTLRVSPEVPAKAGMGDSIRRAVSAPGTALLARIDKGALERVRSEGIGVEPGGQQGFDLGE